MQSGARITDAVEHFHRRGDLKRAVKLVRTRSPERLRWRSAVGTLTRGAGQLGGLDRMRVEEPIREMVLDLPDTFLQREVVLDARLRQVDLDRGEVLPRWSMGDLRRMVHVARLPIDRITRYVRLPVEFDQPVDTAALVLVGRFYAAQHRERAEHLWLQIPDEDGPEPMRLHHQYMAQRAQQDADAFRRWAAFSRGLSGITTRPVTALS